MTKEELKPLLTDEFLATLEKAVKVCGDSVDLVETQEFLTWCFDTAGKEQKDQ